MPWEEEDQKTNYRVVVNDEEQYSIWPDRREIPLGWREEGKSGLKQDCLEYIEHVWTDMRPLSLRKRIAEMQPQPAPADSPELPPDDLVDRLSERETAVVIQLRGEDRVERLKESVDNDYVLITFVNTKGGTELGVRLDKERCDLTRADFANRAGTMRLVGTLRLNGLPVECVAEIAIETLEGVGRLERH
jgi:uncharacterized protein YbdZ (MbtH family)